MLFRLIKYFRGYVEVSLWGYAPERFFNLCSSHDILIWDLTQEADVYHFKVSVEGFKLLRPMLKKSGTRVRIGKKNGLPFYLFRYRKRKILFLSVFLCMGILFALSRFLWKININGNDSVTDDSILKFLAEQNSSYGTNVSDIDCARLEEELRSTFADIIWTSVRREGTTLTIDVQENLVVTADTAKQPVPKEFSRQHEQGYDLRAMHDGTVRGIYVRRGTPCVQAGDVVSKGAVLVSGALPIYDDSGEVSAYQYCTADADIRLQTSYAYRDSFAMRHKKRVYTGRRVTHRGLYFGASIVRFPAKKVSFAHYSMTEARRQLRLCDSFYLPLGLVRRDYEEYSFQRVRYTKQEATAQAAANLSDFLEKLTQKGVLILEKNVMIKADKNKCCATGSITVEEHTFRYAPNQDRRAEIIQKEGNTGNESE